LLALAARAADRIYNVLADPEASVVAVDQAAKVVSTLASAVDRLRPAGKRPSRSDADETPPAAPTGNTADEAHARAQLDRVAATLGTEAGESEAA
jgi:hypothetical protein